MELVAKSFRGECLDGAINQPYLRAFGSRHDDMLCAMILNLEETGVGSKPMEWIRPRLESHRSWKRSQTEAKEAASRSLRRVRQGLPMWMRVGSRRRGALEGFIPNLLPRDGNAPMAFSLSWQVRLDQSIACQVECLAAAVGAARRTL